MTTEIITRAEWENHRTQATMRRGGPSTRPYSGIRPRVTTYGEMPGVEPSHLFVQRIDRAEWPERIADYHKQPSVFQRTRGILPNHDQNGHSNCWCQGPTRGVEIATFLSGGPAQILSAESVTVPIDGRRDNGGNPEDALRQLIDFGACLQNLWPANDLNERHADPTWKEERKNHRIIRFVDVRDFDDQMSLLLHNCVVNLALPWWSHDVLAIDPEQIGPHDFGCRIDNSWGNWGDQGTKILDEESATTDGGAFGVLLTTIQRLPAPR